MLKLDMAVKDKGNQKCPPILAGILISFDTG